MKCLECQRDMEARVEDVDYSRLAGIPSRKVLLCALTTRHCLHCKESQSFIEIPRCAALHRELQAAKALHVKHLRFTFVDNEWVLSLETSPQTPRKPPRKRNS